MKQTKVRTMVMRSACTCTFPLFRDTLHTSWSLAQTGEAVSLSSLAFRVLLLLPLVVSVSVSFVPPLQRH